jgi:5'-nucleotidase
VEKPLILVTNDDGITAKGIATLIEVASQIGEVIVVAPDSPQSGKGHAITISDPLRLEKNNIYRSIEAYQCSGTPADCVKIAKKMILKDRKISLVVSGVNHGSNSSISVIYSGTMSAAIEAAIENIPSIGFSLLDYASDADFSHTKAILKQIIEMALEKTIPAYTALNVNIPSIKNIPIKGIKWCRQALARWQEEYERRVDPNGRSYYWASGNLVNEDQAIDTDEYALSAGYVTIVPCRFDLTSYAVLDKLQVEWEFSL